MDSGRIPHQEPLLVSTLVGSHQWQEEILVASSRSQLDDDSADHREGLAIPHRRQPAGMEEILPEVEVGLDPQKVLTQHDEHRYVQDPTCHEVVEL
jgi:hypothetical protein